MSGILLTEYIQIRSSCCDVYHPSNAKCVCKQLCKAGSIILKQCIVPLLELFRTCFKERSYSAKIARQQLLQMPLVAVRVDLPQCGQSEYETMEYQADFYYEAMRTYLQSIHTNQQRETLPKEKLRELLDFAQSKREKEVIKASGLSATATRMKLEIENVSERLKAVEHALHEADELRRSIDNLCNTKERAVLQSLGLKELSSTSGSDESGCENDSEGVSLPYNFSPEDLRRICRESSCN